MGQGYNNPARKDIFPRREVDFKDWSVVFINEVEINGYKWSIPGLASGGPAGRSVVAAGSLFEGLKLLHDDFVKKFDITVNPLTRTKVSVVEKNLSLSVFQRALRRFVGAYIARNPLVSGADRERMGLYERKRTRTKVGAVRVSPFIAACALDGHRVRVFYHNLHSSGRAKPYGVNGVEIAYSLLEARPSSAEDLSRVEFATRTPFTLQFDASDAGKTVYLSACWINTRGRRGPWSAIASAVIV